VADTSVTFRAADAADEPVLREMLKLAVFVPPGSPAPDDSVFEQPELTRYVRGWGRPGDEGIIAVAAGDKPIAAAWMRLWSVADCGYGFIDTRTPELSVAVRPEYRGRGIGTELLQRLLQRADHAFQSVSLSVSLQNPAVRLYQRLGFDTVVVDGGSMIMRRRGAEHRSDG
jgi:GNAT superfamily N-acetyltransferase